jgi:hypothetical protein
MRSMGAISKTVHQFRSDTPSANSSQDNKWLIPFIQFKNLRNCEYILKKQRRYNDVIIYTASRLLFQFLQIVCGKIERHK